jgi:hypothetical protein
VFLASPGDWDEIHELHAVGANYVIVPFEQADGDYARKINWGAQLCMLMPDCEWVFTGADDLLFHEDWFEQAMKVARPHHGVIGTQDRGQPRVIAGTHSTHSLIRRSYIAWGTVDEPNKIYHEGYPHEFVDDELVATAKRRGAWVFSPDSIVEHMHPHWGKGKTDRIYKDFDRRMRIGRRLWDRRRQEFGL